MLRNTPKAPLSNLRATQALIKYISCPLPESMDDVEYVDEERTFRSDCTNAHAHLGLHFGIWLNDLFPKLHFKWSCRIITVGSYGVRVFRINTGIFILTWLLIRFCKCECHKCSNFIAAIANWPTSSEMVSSCIEKQRFSSFCLTVQSHQRLWPPLRIL